MAVRPLRPPGQPAGARDPLAADRRGRLGNTRVTPVVTTLIVINVVVYIWEMASHAGIYVVRAWQTHAAISWSAGSPCGRRRCTTVSGTGC